MIVVVGEALVDLVIDAGGHVTATLGGAPVNTARTCGRLGADVALAGSISIDRFGTMLAAQLEADHVSLDLVQRCDLPTTLAAAELDSHGAATYRFYVDGTSAPAFTAPVGDVKPSALFTGGLALVLEPMAATVDGMIAVAPAACLVMVDVNCRPHVIPDRDRYLARLERMMARADVVKVSDDDLRYLAPDATAIDAARQLLWHGPRVVLLTAGGDAVHVVTAGGEAAVPVPPVSVVDTIGAGDAFSGGFLAWWAACGHTLDDLASFDHVGRAVSAASAVAGIVCTRRGADPPWRHELPESWAAAG